jgi:hypothetical protein
MLILFLKGSEINKGFKKKGKVVTVLKQYAAMKIYGGVDVQIHVFLNLELVGNEWSASRSGHFTPRERAPGTHWIGG